MQPRIKGIQRGSRRAGLIGLSIVFVAGGPSVLAAAPSGGDAPVVTVTSTAGAVYGNALEIVFFNNVMLSELVWPLEPSFSVGTRVSVEWPTGVALSLGASSGLPMKVGTITDSDWLDIAVQPGGGTNPIYMTGNNAKTNLSEHDSYLEGSTIIDGRIGWNMKAAEALTIQPYLGYKYIDYKWSARDGYYQYPPEYTSSPSTYSQTFPANPATYTSQPYTPWSASEPKTPLYGLVALYEQSYSVPLIGLSTRYRLTRVFSFEGTVSFSPIASLTDVDHHILTQAIYTDSFSACTYIEPTLSVTAQFAGGFQAQLDLSYLNITAPNNGTIVMEDVNPSSSTYGQSFSFAGSANTAGAALSTFGATLSFAMSF